MIPFPWSIVIRECFPLFTDGTGQHAFTWADREQAEWYAARRRDGCDWWPGVPMEPSCRAVPVPITGGC